MKPITLTYELEHLAGLSDNEHDVDITAFTPVVYFTAKGEPRIPLSTSVWNDWNKPRRIKLTLEPAA